MDHPASVSRPYPWRTAAIVAAAVAALELVLILLVVFAFAGEPSGETAEKTAPSRTPAKAKPAVAKLPRNKTSVLILNGNGAPGAAGDTADLVRTRHYLVAGTGNAPRTDFARTIVMFRPGYRGEAERLARDFHFKRVAPLDGLTRADLQGAHVAIIVGGP